MDEKLYDVWLTVHIPIVVAVSAKSKKEAKRIAADMYNDGTLHDRVITSIGENNEIVTCTGIEHIINDGWVNLNKDNSDGHD